MDEASVSSESLSDRSGGGMSVSMRRTVDELEKINEGAQNDYTWMKQQRDDVMTQAQRATDLAAQVHTLNAQVKQAGWEADAQRREWARETEDLTQSLRSLRQQVATLAAQEQEQVQAEKSEGSAMGTLMSQRAEELDRDLETDPERRRSRDVFDDPEAEKEKERRGEVAKLEATLEDLEALRGNARKTRQTLDGRREEKRVDEVKILKDRDDMRKDRIAAYLAWERERRAMVQAHEDRMADMEADHKREMDKTRRETKEECKKKDAEIERLRQQMESQHAALEHTASDLDRENAARLQDQKQHRLEIQNAIAKAFERNSTKKLMRDYYDKLEGFAAYRARTRKMQKLQKELMEIADTVD